MPGVVHEADEVSRICGVAAEDELAQVVSHLQPRTARHLATRLMRFEDAWVLNGDLYVGPSWMRLRDAPPSWRGLPEPAELDDALLVSSEYGLRYFGHWMHDDLPREMLALDQGSPALSVLVRPTAQQAAYAARLGLSSRAFDHVRVRRLSVVDDRGQNRHRRERYRRLQQRALAGDRPVPCTGIYVRRGTGGSARSLDNEAEVATLADRLGLRTLDPQTTPVRDFITLGAGAALVMGLEGSHLINALMWMQPGAHLLMLHPPQRFNLTCKDLADALRVQVGSHIGIRTGESSFRVEIDRVEALALRLLAGARVPA